MRRTTRAERAEPTSPAPDGSQRRGDVMWFTVTDACNAHCTFCAEHVPRATDDLRDRGALRRLAALLAADVPGELLFTGGEPTLHPLLGEMLAMARDAGVARRVLYTNAMALADERRLQTWIEAGLTTVRASLFAVGEDANALMRHPRAWQLASRGVQASIDAGLTVQIATVLHRGTLPHSLGLFEHVAAQWPTVERAVIAPYVAMPPFAPDELHVAPRRMEKTLRAVMKTLKAVGIPAFPDPGYGFHLCAFTKVRPLSSLLRRGTPSGAGQTVLLPGCRDCALQRRCGGVERSLAAALGEAVIEPITDARRATWLPVFDRTEASDRTDRIAVVEKTSDGGRVFREQVIRIIHACNQRCAFCWVDFEAPTMTVAEIVAAIRDNRRRIAGQAGVADQPFTVTFTGGEPTMHPHIAKLVALAREEGADRVHIQTNAVQCADNKVAQSLAAAGLSEALVSLHAADASASDKLTAAPGTFERSLQGIANLCAAGVDVVINHVLTAQLAPAFPAFVKLVHERLAHPRLVLTVAVAGRIDRGPLDDSVLPKLSSLAEPLREGLALAAELGLPVRDLVHPCGIPPCILGGDEAIFDRRTMRQVTTCGVVGEAEGCIKPTTCRTCAFDRHCFGVRREYAEEHGTDELVPVPAAGRTDG